MNLFLVKYKLITWIANGSPVLMNFHMFPENIKENKSMVYLPAKAITMDEAIGSAVLVPTNKIKVVRECTSNLEKDDV